MQTANESVFLRRQGIKCRALAYGTDAGTADKLVRLAQELFDRADEIDGRRHTDPPKVPSRRN